MPKTAEELQAVADEHFGAIERAEAIGKKLDEARAVMEKLSVDYEEARRAANKTLESLYSALFDGFDRTRPR